MRASVELLGWFKSFFLVIELNFVGQSVRVGNIGFATHPHKHTANCWRGAGILPSVCQSRSRLCLHLFLCARLLIQVQSLASLHEEPSS